MHALVMYICLILTIFWGGMSHSSFILLRPWEEDRIAQRTPDRSGPVWKHRRKLSRLIQLVIASLRSCLGRSCNMFTRMMVTTCDNQIFFGLLWFVNVCDVPSISFSFLSQLGQVLVRPCRAGTTTEHQRPGKPEAWYQWSRLDQSLSRIIQDYPGISRQKITYINIH